jgi:phosphoenolpyruvate carboxykinase (ATP)
MPDRQADAGASDVSFPLGLHGESRRHRTRPHRGVEPEFSTRFGAPFLPRHPSVYGNLLRELIGAHGVDCWLVNTGWTGGRYGVGRRMPIKVTRTLLTAALDGSLKNAKFRTDPYFGFSVPTALPGVEPHLLYPYKTWQNKAEFDETARKLVRMFQENFTV